MLFLHGGAWRKTPNEIVEYGDLDMLPSWKYLDSNIVPGGRFQLLQLIPSLASDVFLHGRITGRQPVTTPAGTFPNAIECEYLVDYGVSARTDDEGNPIGYSREVAYGTVACVDSLGPVAATARHSMRVVSTTQVTNAVGAEEAILTGTMPVLARVAARRP
jgi:hypothetical protein